MIKVNVAFFPSSMLMTGMHSPCSPIFLHGCKTKIWEEGWRKAKK